MQCSYAAVCYQCRRVWGCYAALRMCGGGWKRLEVAGGRLQYSTVLTGADWQATVDSRVLGGREEGVREGGVME